MSIYIAYVHLVRADRFYYLSFVLNFNGKNVSQLQVATQGRKAMYVLKYKTKSVFLNTHNLLSLFDTHVKCGAF